VKRLAQAIQEDCEKAETEWKASVVWKGGFKSSGMVRGFNATSSDEPAALGGTDSAPNPVEQVLAAYGSCLAVGFAAQATMANVKINALKIEISGKINLSTFLGLNGFDKGQNGNAGFENIQARLNISADTTPEILEELLKKVVNTSPVGHTLSSAVPVTTSLKLMN
jgi:uncharacterized OsmC-like protein